MKSYLTVPGLGNSGEEHWQTYFEHRLPIISRIQQENWDVPDCDQWVKNIQATVSLYDQSALILIGHSLGCSAIAHWANKYNHNLKGALLVAPSDPESPAYTFPSKGFDIMPLQKLNFKSIVVASANDPWVSLDRAMFFAERWGSIFINIGEAGHINASSGFGKWERGLEILNTI